MNNQIHVSGMKSGGCAALIHPTGWLVNKWVGWIHPKGYKSDNASAASAVRRHSVGWISDSASTKNTVMGVQR